MPTLKWKRKDRYAEVTENGEYSVCAIGGPGGYRFEGWRTRLHRDGPHLICNLASAEECRRLGEEDSRA